MWSWQGCELLLRKEGAKLRAVHGGSGDRGPADSLREIMSGEESLESLERSRVISQPGLQPSSP